MVKKLGALLLVGVLLVFGYTKFKDVQFSRSFDPAWFDSQSVKRLIGMYGKKRIELNRYDHKGYTYFYTTRNLQVIYFTPSLPWQIVGSVESILRDSSQPMFLEEVKYRMDSSKIPVAEIMVTKIDGSSFKVTFIRSSVGVFVVFESFPKGKPASTSVRKLSRNGIYALLGLIELIKAL